MWLEHRIPLGFWHCHLIATFTVVTVAQCLKIF